MLLIIRSSRARMSGSERAPRRWLYVRVVCDVERESRESWRSFSD